MRVGDPVGVGRGAVAHEFAVDRGPASLGMLEFLEHHHRRALAKHEAVAVVVERPARPGRLVVPRGERREQVEARDAERMDHAVGAAGEHHVGLAAANDLGRLADRLAGGGAGGEAVEVGTLRVEESGQVPGRHVGLLLDLCLRVQRLEPEFRELRHVEGVTLDGGQHHPGEGVEILLPLAAAQVDAQPRRVGRQALPQAGVGHRLQRRSRRKPRVSAAERPGRRILSLVGDVPAPHLG